MAPIAKIFHNLPELSDDFRRLLKDLMDSAPDELPSTQVRVAADLTDTPYDEGLRRMSYYLDTPTPKGYMYKVPSTNIVRDSTTSPTSYEKRIVNRLRRSLTADERQKLGDRSIYLTDDSSIYSPRVEAVKNMSTARGSGKGAAYDYWLNAAIESRKEAQRRMALEYLLEGLL